MQRTTCLGFWWTQLSGDFMNCQINLKYFPVLTAVHTSSASISVILETARTTSVLMALIMIFQGMGHVQYEMHAIFFVGTFFHTIPSSAQLK